MRGPQLAQVSAAGSPATRIALSRKAGRRSPRSAAGLVGARPRLLAVLTVLGTAALLWVGGHILLPGGDELGLHCLYGAVHHPRSRPTERRGASTGRGRCATR